MPFAKISILKEEINIKIWLVSPKCRQILKEDKFNSINIKIELTIMITKFFKMFIDKFITIKEKNIEKIKINLTLSENRINY